MKLIIVIAAAAGLASAQRPQTPPATQNMPQDMQVIRLWQGDAPGAQGTAEADVPTITAWLPRTTRPGMTAVIVCPGGGYVHLATNHEGRQVANYLNSLGIAAFVLTYRLGPKYHHPVELEDAQRAIRMVRSKAKDWNIAPDRIGIMGFSAGGHLAASASTQFAMLKASSSDPMDAVSARPDFAVLGYAVISLTAPWTHQGSKNALLGNNPPADLVNSLSGELAVTKETPPTFLFSTNGDTTVPAENSIYYYLALRKAGVAAEMHIFQRGSHGQGLGMDDFALAEWPKLLANWMRVNNFIK